MPRAVVVGGGPAGAASALTLLRFGWGVTLVEKSVFPRHKVCGECLSALGWAVVERLGLADRLIESGAVRLTRAVVRPMDGEGVELALPEPMWGISRWALDAALLDAVVEAGAEVLRPARAEGVEGGDRPGVWVRGLMSNEVKRVGGDVVILADGGATAGRWRTGDLGVKAHFRGDAGDAIELWGLGGCYAGLSSVEGGRWCVAMSLPAARVRERGLTRAAEEAIRTSPQLVDRLAGRERVLDWMAGPLARHPVVERWERGVVPVGNAAAALEPIGGEGMGLAMRSGEMAAQAIATGMDLEELRRAYRRLWGLRRAACRAGALVLSSPAASSCVRWLESDWLVRGLLGAVGK